MAKTCLRELLGQVPKSYMEYEPATHALLEALVKIVDGLVETVYPIRGPEFWQQRCRNTEHELALALTSCEEAKAEIERLRHELSAAADLSYERAQERAADAELGRLVRGMRETGSLFRNNTRYVDAGWVARWQHVFKQSGDPAVALRAIQEVGDGRVS